MPSPYRAIFAVPGTKRFSAAGFIGRMPLSMLGIGIVTMVSQVTGRYGLAGALSATLALSSAALGPQVSRLVDRFGQRRVLRPVSAVTVLAVGGLLLCSEYRAPYWTLFGCAVVAGCMPSLGSMVRARWAAIYAGTPGLHTAYALESVVDEICFIIGPILSIGLCTVWFPEAGPLLAAGFLATGTFLLTAQRSTEPAPHPGGQHEGGSALRSRGLQVLVITFVATGAIFGAVDVSTLAFAQEQGHKAAASLVLAVYASGSCLAGAIFGLLRPKGRASHRFVLGICVMAVSMIPPLLVGNLAFLAVALFVSGLTIAPTMVTAMALVEQLVPRAKLTEGMTWTSTGLAVGVALGASLAGSVTDSSGARAAFVVPASGAALAAVVAFLGYRRLRPAPGLEGQRTYDQHNERHRDEDYVA
ncbi:MFS transporter [Actinacidiphila oryziradicis]|uniref:MFS transporter n=1 Tax=Actinacidiphila oryziradicis TaxID=2571141 RepID=A0A4U0SJR5_9ACTN|nr:MFS transporter [Actinacidiphila oryziradicis]MCW2869686.1 putative transrane efflux protein [Actinacidiphila oryziradicis]TKA09383.1 MFS transporter [Actinacidiphila oryziradicis]